MGTRSKAMIEGDSDSECEDQTLEKMVKTFMKIKTNSKSTDFGDFMSLPKDMDEIKLSANLESGIEEGDLYLKKDGDIMVQNLKKNKAKPDDYSGAALAVIKPHIGKKKMKKLKKLEKEKTKGSDWYNMPALEMTEERQRDLELLQMRGVLIQRDFTRRMPATISLNITRLEQLLTVRQTFTRTEFHRRTGSRPWWTSFLLMLSLKSFRRENTWKS